MPISVSEIAASSRTKAATSSMRIGPISTLSRVVRAALVTPFAV
jgi:hypothetical protein